MIIFFKGKTEPLKFKKIDANTYETSYNPAEPGNYTVNLQFGGSHIAKSPFKVRFFYHTMVEQKNPFLFLATLFN